MVAAVCFDLIRRTRNGEEREREREVETGSTTEFMLILSRSLRANGKGTMAILGNN